MGFPNGLWAVNGNTFVSAPWRQADIFCASGVPVQAHENYGAVGILNIANFLDPTPRGDIELANRRTAASMDVMTGYFDVMNSSGIYNFGIDSTGFVA